MKNRKLLFILPGLVFALASCSFGDFFKITKDEEKQNFDPEDIEPQDPRTHATSVSGDPNASFYLKVGEKRTTKVTLSPNPTMPDERKFTWNVDNQNFVKMAISEDTKSAELEGLKAGTAKVTATNTYSNSLKHEFIVKVIDYDVENNYLWEYKTADRSEQFGYNQKERSLGYQSGTAVLNGKEWHYSRSNMTSLQSSHGAIGFGKGKDPETNITLTSTNSRIIDKIVIETASAKSLAKLNVSIGDVKAFDNVTVPDLNYDVIPTLSSLNGLAATGDITISFDTPEFDPSRAEDPTYNAPGCVYLKSILIYYQQEAIQEVRIAEDSTQRVDYFKGDVFSYEGLKLEKVTSRGTIFDVDVEEHVEAGLLSIIPPSLDVESHEEKLVHLALTVKGYDEPFRLSYPIHVRSDAWTPEKMEVIGEVTHQGLIAGDEVDYSGLKIKVTYEAEHNDILDYEFSEYSIFTFSYGLDGDPFIAESNMNEGYTISVVGHFVPNDEGVRSVTLATTYSIPANVLTVQEAIYDRIDFRKATVKEALDIKTDAKALSYTSKNNRATINFDSVKKGYRLTDHYEFPITNKNFNIIINDKNYTIDKLNVEFANSSKSSNSYRFASSIYGGDIWTNDIGSADNNRIVYSNFDDYTNAVLFQPELTSTGSLKVNNMCVVSILLRYKEVPQVNYTIEATNKVPNKVDYTEGEKFDPSGLSIMLSSNLNETPLDITQYFKWYDGATYSTAKQETLTPSSTYVVGEFHDYTINIYINSVTEKRINLSLVTDTSDITADGKYYITSPSNYAINLGSKKGKLANKEGCAIDDNVSFKDNLSINILYENDYYTITPEEGGFYSFLTTQGNSWGLTDKCNISNSGTTAHRNFEISINEYGIATVKITATSSTGAVVTMYLGFGGTVFNLYKENKQNIAIYKVND